jgi:poly-gamma-glutamate capsule biosynthesis protein CapA/YwtB (metallophosphatase superfamily)
MTSSCRRKACARPPLRLAILLCASAAAAGAAFASAQEGPAAPGTPPARLFDSRRPPERELETSISDGFTLAAVGDCITSRPLAQALARDAGFAAVVGILRDADAAFGNFETSAIDIRAFKGSPHSWAGDWALSAPPEVARDLKTLGFDLVSRANNHALDWGLEGMRETDRWLDEAGLVHAGTGEQRGAARAARYLETGKGRLGIVSMASTFPEFAEALPPRGEAPGRPGVNALKTTRETIVTPETMRALVSIRDALAAGGKECAGAPDADTSPPSPGPPGQPQAGIDLFSERFRPGDRTGYHYVADPIDLDENLRSIRQGKQHSDLLVATIHAHEEGFGCDEPADFLRELAHAAIDAGAGAFLVHGVHRLGPIEVYRDRPIFYGLANFFWSDIQQPLPASLFEQNRDLLAAAFGDPGRATDADLTALLNASGFRDERVFQTIVTVTRYEKGRAAEILMYPVDLGYGLRLTKSGVPRLASPAAGRAILERLQRLSRPYGTVITIEKNVGVIRPR